MKIFIATILTTLFMLISTNIFAVNSMPLMQSFRGAYGNDWYGESIVAMDFNADSFDDLIVYTRNNYIPVPPEVLVYFGGAVMDTIPDLSTNGLPPARVSALALLNAGDANGDGYEDLLILEKYPSTVAEPADTCALRFFWGGPDADLEPDFQIVTAYYNGDPKILPTSCIGDVNNDGYDDLACSTFNHDNYSRGVSILLGGTWDLICIQDNLSHARFGRINGIGDVNADGIDDFIAGFGLDTDEGSTAYRYLYYGSSPLNLENRILLYEVIDAGEQHYPGGYGTGDFNSDGYDDFVYCYGSSYFSNNRLRLGGLDILNTSELTLTPHPYYNLMDFANQGIAYGDFNGDGYSDLAGSDYQVINWTGDAGMWLGKEHPNGTYDLRIATPPTSPFHQFGWQLESGDFNGDGFCDLAISAPSPQDGDPWYHGYVYIFAGNAELSDTTVANDDPSIPAIPEGIKVHYYPNPNNSRDKQISYTIEGKLPQTIDVAIITIHNIKGQVVERNYPEANSLKSGTGTISLKKLKPGIYIAQLRINGKKLSTEKFTIVK